MPPGSGTEHGEGRFFGGKASSLHNGFVNKTELNGMVLQAGVYF